MRILITSTHLELVGGVEACLGRVIPSLLDRGHQVAILHELPGKKGKNLLDLDKYHLHAICSYEEGLYRAVANAKKWDPDIVYNHGLLNQILEAEVLKDWPGVFYCHSIFGTCLSGTKFWRWPEAELCQRKFGLGCLCRYGLNRCGGRNPFKMFSLYRKSRKRLKIAAKYQRVLVASNWMRDVFLQNGLSPAQVSLASLFPIEVLPDIAPPARREQQNLLLFVGRIVENKGWRHAIQATRLAESRLKRKLRLVMAGSGPEADKVEPFARKCRVDVEFKGNLKPVQLEAWRRQADLQLVPSLTGEGFGLVGIEAGCFGLPSVGFPAGGVVEWLIPGKTGEMTSPIEMNPQGLAGAICRALGNIDHWQELRLGAWRKSIEFNLEKHLDTVEQVLIRCIEN